MDLRQRNGESAVRYAICSVYKPAMISMIFDRWWVQWPLAVAAGVLEWSYSLFTSMVQMRLIYWAGLILLGTWMLIILDFITGLTRAHTSDEDLAWKYGTEWTFVKMANATALILGASVLDILYLDRLAVMIAIGLLVGVKELISAAENTRYATPEFKEYIRSFLPWNE